MDYFDDVPRMTKAAVDALVGPGPTKVIATRVTNVPDVDDGFLDLNRLIWQITAALKDADLVTGMGFAGRGVATPCVEPPMPDLDFDFPMPVWEDV